MKITKTQSNLKTTKSGIATKKPNTMLSSDGFMIKKSNAVRAKAAPVKSTMRWSLNEMNAKNYLGKAKYTDKQWAAMQKKK